MSFLLKVSRAISRYNKYRKIYNELSALEDRDLSDMGINRCDIPYVAKKAVS